MAQNSDALQLVRTPAGFNSATFTRVACPMLVAHEVMVLNDTGALLLISTDDSYTPVMQVPNGTLFRIGIAASRRGFSLGETVMFIQASTGFTQPPMLIFTS